jgi:signal transduction histidine kinase
MAIGGYGSPLQLGNGNHYTLKGHLSYFEDSSGTVKLSQVQKKSFLPYEKENVNFGFTKSTYWFKIDLERDFQAARNRWWLMIDYPLLEKIDVYLVDKSGNLISQRHLGSSISSMDRELPLRDFVTELPLYEYSETVLYVSVKTQSSMQIPLSIYSSESLFQEVERNNLAMGIYYGIFLIILFYNGGIFFYTKDRNYLRYIFFLSSFILWQLSFDGVGTEYLWRDCFWLIEHGASFWIAMSAFSALYFGQSFLQTSRYSPKVNSIIRMLMGFSLAMASASLILPYGKVIVINTALAAIVPIILFTAGVIVMNRGYRPARFYVAGWSSLLIGTLIFAFNKFNIIPGFYGVNHIQQIGSAIEMIFLSWALAERVHLLQAEYIDKLSHLNETLIEKVNYALKEARMKDQMFVQQSRLAALGEMIEQIAHQWRQPLNTLALINQNLYVKHKLNQCTEECFERSHEQFNEHLQYMSKTIDDFRNYYKTDKAKHSENIGELVQDALNLSDVFLKYAKIKTTVTIKTEKKAKLAKNEMIQVLINLIKNAHDAIKGKKDLEGRIDIALYENNGVIELTIEDNAGGIPREAMDKIFDIYFTTKNADQGSGLGLYMSKYIIEESFGGTIQVENRENGACFVIRLPISDSETLS